MDEKSLIEEMHQGLDVFDDIYAPTEWSYAAENTKDKEVAEENIRRLTEYHKKKILSELDLPKGYSRYRDIEKSLNERFKEIEKIGFPYRGKEDEFRRTRVTLGQYAKQFGKAKTMRQLSTIIDDNEDIKYMESAGSGLPVRVPSTGSAFWYLRPNDTIAEAIQKIDQMQNESLDGELRMHHALEFVRWRQGIIRKILWQIETGVETDQIEIETKPPKSDGIGDTAIDHAVMVYAYLFAENEREKPLRHITQVQISIYLQEIFGVPTPKPFNHLRKTILRGKPIKDGQQIFDSLKSWIDKNLPYSWISKRDGYIDRAREHLRSE